MIGSSKVVVVVVVFKSHHPLKLVPFNIFNQGLYLIVIQFFQSLGDNRVFIVLKLFGLEN